MEDLSTWPVWFVLVTGVEFCGWGVAGVELGGRRRRIWQGGGRGGPPTVGEYICRQGRGAGEVGLGVMPPLMAVAESTRPHRNPDGHDARVTCEQPPAAYSERLTTATTSCVGVVEGTRHLATAHGLRTNPSRLHDLRRARPRGVVVCHAGYDHTQLWPIYDACFLGRVTT